jgi:hypothetical protein
MIYKFRKAGAFTDVTLYKRRVGGVWEDVDTGKFKKAVDGWTLYWDRLANKLLRPAEGTYASMGAITFSPDGSIKIGPRYHDPITTSLGTWRNTGLGTAPTDVWSVYVEKYLDQGDSEPGGSAFNTWLQMYPGTTVYKWSSNNGGAGAVVLKVTMKDQNDNQVVWYAELTYGGTGIVSYAPIVWGSGGGDDGGGFPDRPF